MHMEQSVVRFAKAHINHITTLLTNYVALLALFSLSLCVLLKLQPVEGCLGSSGEEGLTAEDQIL